MLTCIFPCSLMSYQGHAETKADKSQTDSSQNGEASESQSSASSPSAFQLIANAFRRTFNVTNPSSGSDSAVIMFVRITACILLFKHHVNAAVGQICLLKLPVHAVIPGSCYNDVQGIFSESEQIFFYFMNQLWFSRRTKCNCQRRQRPLSDGILRCPEPRKDERITGKHKRRWVAAGADAWGGGRDLPSLLQEVSLQGSGGSGPESSGDTQQRPRRRLNLFMSLRLKKQGATDREGQEHEMQKEIRTMLTNIRNKRKWGYSSPLPCNQPHGGCCLANRGSIVI